MTSKAKFEITFLGGASAIGASCALVQVADTSILVDCGVRFRSDALPNLSMLTGKHLDAILLTHAHSDHSGGLPVICEAFPDARVYATPPSIDLVGILLRDALKIMHQAGERDGELPLYSQRQVERVAQNMVPIQHGASVSIGEVEVTYLPASHILGASMVHLATPAGNLMFSGDYSVSAQRTVPALDRPTLRADLVVTESTYGNRLHEDRKAAEERLVARVSQCLEQSGRLLIPAFAVGRAQEVLLILKAAMRNGRMPAVPVFVDGMVRSVCEVYARHQRYVTRSLAHEIGKAGHPFYNDQIQPVRNPKDRNQVLEAGPCVIVASSGMLSGGASVYYARKLAQDPNAAILITGYQDEESPGRTLLELAEQRDGPRRLSLDGQSVEVACQVDKYGLSAHADRMQTIALLEALRPRTVVLVHGDRQSKEELQRGLSCRDVVLAEDGTQVARGYPVRRGKNAKPPELEIDLDAARRFLGPPTDSPLRSEAVAAAWYGRRVGRAERESLIERLEALGVARRDDQRRSHIWVQTARESGLFPDEVELEEVLKRENPKGRLLEFCARGQLDPPAMEDLGSEGYTFLSRWTMRYGGATLDSDIQRATSRKAAEQLAARSLLEQLQEAQNALGIADSLDQADPRAATLSRDNPKGQLIAYCTRQHLPAPRFERQAVVDGVVARVGYAGAGGAMAWSRWYRATSAGLAEQAAAQEVLHRLDNATAAVPTDTAMSAATAEPPLAGAADASEESAGSPGQDMRLLLNQMRQMGFIEDFGYDRLGCEGPPHQPTFLLSAWAQMPAGSRVQTETVAAGSKKLAEREAARLLYHMLNASG